MEIRHVRIEDASDLRSIYAPYVTNTAITFEYAVPSVAEFESRIDKIVQDYPYLVVEVEGRIVGYAYASSYSERAAYHWAVELSIYMDESERGKGLGRLLYKALEKELLKRGYLRFLACIALPNDASIQFHRKQGYQQVAHFPNIGYKFHKWHDIIWMQKSIEGEADSLNGSF
ncbi:Phosphinothricin N-acetyltransferase [Streptococcus sp. DD10]|uniref:GNAT family N-acetyltransferase n=1 Tax=Streptococcus sp. DD10 TaxID=1777878 RepID=UPI000795ED3E|nr:GNAT family N-acetyltransferase [Streptococcus sp. DD10]KXT75130.1 Phosphinothricin N-acetyltransferase [Streptococcus sp. DD10]